MSKEEIEQIMNDKRRKSDTENQKTLRLTIYGLILTVASMLMSGTWLISKIDSKTVENASDIAKMVEAVETTNTKLDKVVIGLSNIEGRLEPITASNNKQAEFGGFMQLFVDAMNKQKGGPSQSVVVGPK